MKRRRASIAAAAIALLAAVAAPAAARDLPLPDVQERTLDNGMKVLILEDHDIPNCTLHVFWHVGSRNERPGITGIAHFFEHMMFMGGAKYGRDFDPVMEAAGGSNNAWTSRDQTVYQDWFPASALTQILDMEADRMSGMVFAPETVESEREVVQSERRLTMEEPIEVLREQLWAAAFTAHPYQWDVFGWPSDIAAWKKSDLEVFFATYYAPQNAVLVLVGDVAAEKAFTLIEERIGKIPRGPEKPPVVTVEPEQRGERRVSVEAPYGNLPAVLMAWHVPPTAHADTSALQILELVLFGGDSSRLNERLVERDELCLEVWGGLEGLQFDSSLFTVDCVLREGGDTAAVEDVLREEIARIAGDGPTEAELTSARAKLRAGFLRRMRTISDTASLIGETETFYGSWRSLPQRLSALHAVTADDVKRVAGQYLTRRNATVGSLVVSPGDEPGYDE